MFKRMVAMLAMVLIALAVGIGVGLFPTSPKAQHSLLHFLHGPFKLKCQHPLKSPKTSTFRLRQRPAICPKDSRARSDILPTCSCGDHVPSPGDSWMTA